ncbi:MAG TPA: hypothetical protein VF516_09525 [Kofleriaceae bacterium]
MKTFGFLLRLGSSLVGLSAVLAAGSPVRADTLGTSLPPFPAWIDPSDAVSPIALVQGGGIKVGEGTVLQPQVGLQTGVVSNVFYQNTNAVTAGLLRLLIEIGTGSLPIQRLNPAVADDGTTPPAPGSPTPVLESGDFQYSANAYLSWDQYLSTNDNVTAQGGLGGGLVLRGLVNPQRPLQFAAQEVYSRLIRPVNFESQADANRDINNVSLRLNYVPTGRSLSGYLYYQNTIDVFESSNQQFANRMLNQFGVHLDWAWLPLTVVSADLSGGYNTGIGSSEKVTSTPLTATAGIGTALTLSTTISAHIGYANGFYASGPSYSSVQGGVLFGYRYSPLGRVTAQYDYSQYDSINANFYSEHLVALTLEQYFASFILFARPELRLRSYQGTIVMDVNGSTTRDDTIVAVTVGMRYNFRGWLAATLDYNLQDDQTDFRYTVGRFANLDPSYIRHELMLGVRAAY